MKACWHYPDRTPAGHPIIAPACLPVEDEAEEPDELTDVHKIGFAIAYETVKVRWKRINSISVWLALLMPAVGLADRIDYAFEAVGYLTYTLFDLEGAPTYRDATLFDVKVGGTNWSIRTEPAIECNGGVGYYQVCPYTNDSILMINALKAAYNRFESPFLHLRAQLQQSDAKDVFLPHAPLRLPDSVSKLLAAQGYKLGHADPNDPKSIHNVATASILKSKYPPADPSYSALLLFAFTSNSNSLERTNNLLLQTWDEGNPRKLCFRRATWQTLAEPPHLISRAEYSWPGKEVFQDGTVLNINTADVADPLGVAARYAVEDVTNFAGVTVPARFKLTRFAAGRRQSNKETVLTTVIGSVVYLKALAVPEPSCAPFPGKTFVTDYRLSSGQLRGAPLAYIVYSNPPSIEQLRSTDSYRHTAAAVKASVPKTSLRWIIIGWLLLPVFFLLFGRRASNHPKKHTGITESAKPNIHI